MNEYGRHNSDSNTGVGTANVLFVVRRLLDLTWGAQHFNLHVLALDWSKAVDSIFAKDTRSSTSALWITDFFRADDFKYILGKEILC